MGCALQIPHDTKKEITIKRGDSHQEMPDMMTPMMQLEEIFSTSGDANCPGSLIMRPPSGPRLENLWDFFDLDQSGFLDRKEVEEMLRDFLTICEENFEHYETIRHSQFDIHAKNFLEHKILEKFEENSDPFVDLVMHSLGDSNDNEKVNKREFLKNAPIVLFSENFFDDTEKLYTKTSKKQDDLSMCTCVENVGSGTGLVFMNRKNDIDIYDATVIVASIATCV